MHFVSYFSYVIFMQEEESLLQRYGIYTVVYTRLHAHIL